ncbi:MAG: phosphoenolpyruvate synthase [Patescibacteria group bacterium]
MMSKSEKFILWFEDIEYGDVGLVGGKNASLGEMFSKLTEKGVNVPDGFALTSKAYWHFLKENKLDGVLKGIFSKFNPASIKNLQATGKLARSAISKANFPKDLEEEIIKAYQELKEEYGENTAVAVRTSGVAEDRPNASFAGQFETYLNVSGKEKLLVAIKKCIISTFTDRAIAYREEKKISQLEFALSVGVQKMVRSDLASSGIIFTLDTETGFKNVLLINSIWGIGEMIVKGKITPDQFYFFKPTKAIIVKNLGRKNKKYIFSSSGGLKEVSVPAQKQLEFSLTDEEISKLASWALIIEEHYGIAEDIEWAKDGQTGELFIVQSRPETIYNAQKENIYEEYEIKTDKKPILTGAAVGNKIGQGKVHIIQDVSKIFEFKKGEILVTRMTDPDWVSIFPMASAIITEEGGKTCHAAIVSRELGVPAIVGAKNAAKILKNGQMITADCSQGMQGKIFDGKIDFEIKRYNLKNVPEIKTLPTGRQVKIMVNIGAPDMAFKTSFLPVQGVGLAREEFIIAEKIKVHPLALYHFNTLKDRKLKKKIAEITVEHKDKKEFFVKELAEGIAQIAAGFYPREVIVRFSDFKTNEYRNLVGGELFEGNEENPMLGFRGASRYLDKEFQPAFQMECQAIKLCREVFGLNNISVMVPFCRTPEEGRAVRELITKFGLLNLKVYVMCEIPSNVILADKFLDIFDGMSIGSNDLTQLVLGMDRDNAKIAYISDERNEAVKHVIKKVIETCKRRNKYIGICGQAPSDFPDFAEFLVEQGIDSISLNPDTVIKTILNLSKNKNNLNSTMN